MTQQVKNAPIIYPLARRMTIIIILWSVLFTFISAAVQVFLDYRQENTQLETRFQLIETVEIPSLTNSVWHFDHKQIETQLQGMLNLQDVVYVELQVTGGDTYTAGRLMTGADAILRTYPLNYMQNGETFAVGELKVTADQRSLLTRVAFWLIRNLIFSMVQISLLAGFILFVINWLLTRPLREIVNYAETLDLDHLEKSLVLQPRRLASSKDELELLALKLNEMRLRLMDDVVEQTQMQDALRESERNYREIFNATSEAIFIHDATDGRILQVNQSMLRMYGYDSEDELIHQTVSKLSMNEPPYTQVEAGLYIQKAFEEGPQIFEWQARKKDGELFWAEVSLMSTSIGGENRILAVVRDISERKHAEHLLLAQNEALIRQGHALEEAEAQTRQLNADLEKRVRERTLQLAALNEELEAFSYSVAHDLRAPLRHMNGYSQILLDEHSAALDDEARHLLQRIHQSTRNLAEMVDALLGLARLTREELRVSSFDLSALACAVADDLRLEEPERQVALKITPNLVVDADQRLMRIVLENLLGNAWKFTAKSQPAQIELGLAAPVNGEKMKTYYVRDNGAGFDMAYADRLFSPFQRLHTAADFSGTGIGLATVKRIIQRHGGRVWAESAVDNGATFYFTLPA
ncbi:MAG TPA: PAS domain S-box protein [Anaerolineaceae bacterium]|nr:PAS domain S-box protein [Anaerolineaceae bacterium]HPN51021.1 PAS domain S-box protein [Anaerolineaceae bacterium]